MIGPLPGSGNHMVDAEDRAQDEAERQSKTLDCGCYKYCTCDADERFDD